MYAQHHTLISILYSHNCAAEWIVCRYTWELAREARYVGTRISASSQLPYIMRGSVPGITHLHRGYLSSPCHVPILSNKERIEARYSLYKDTLSTKKRTQRHLKTPERELSLSPFGRGAVRRRVCR